MFVTLRAAACRDGRQGRGVARSRRTQSFRPFAVKALEWTIEAVGTHFEVRRGKSIDVRVAEGKVHNAKRSIQRSILRH